MHNLNNEITGFQIDKNLPNALPFGHMSVFKKFKSITEKGCLEPTQCKIFETKLLYFSYGRICHRSKFEPSENELELPIAFLFRPRHLKKIKQFFPYDTGAAQAGKYGSKWSNELKKFKKFCVYNTDSEIPCKMVHKFYGTNSRYVRGEAVSPDMSESKQNDNSSRILFNFFSEDLSTKGIDHRQRMIECQSEEKIDLRTDLMWAAFPEKKIEFFYEFCKKYLNGNMPDYEAYETKVNFIPAFYEMKIEEMADKLIEKLYIKPFK